MISDALSGKKILVAEDNTINQIVVKSILVKCGVIVDLASTGAEAVEKLGKNTYDVVLMDLQMPVMDGLEATQLIRKKLHNNVPIIALTAFDNTGEDSRCYEAGMNGYLSKPFTVDSLNEAILKVLPTSCGDEEAADQENSMLLTEGNITVDISMLYEVSDNDDSFIHLMVQTFLDSLPETIRQIEAHLAAKDWDALYKAAHYAKSSLSIIKVTGMYEGFFEMETYARQHSNLEALPALFKRLKEAFRVAEQILMKKFILMEQQ